MLPRYSLITATDCW